MTRLFRGLRFMSTITITSVPNSARFRVLVRTLHMFSA